MANLLTSMYLNSLAESEFPDALPGVPGFSAFGVRRTHLHEVIYVPGGIWQHRAGSIEEIADERVRHLAQTLNLDLPMLGQVSSCHALTLDDDAKVAAEIPREAEWFCWGNPLAVTDENRQKVHDLELSDSPDVAFLLYGGFMYFNNAVEGNAPGQLIQCNSLIPANQGLLFGPPIPFKGASNRQFQNQLVAQGRFQDITIESMRNKGARYFCWLLPGEHSLCENGGFLYLFNEDHYGFDRRDCYFKVLGDEEYQETWNRINDYVRRQENPVDDNVIFGYVGMKIEQLQRARAYVDNQRAELHSLFERRQAQEDAIKERLKDMDNKACILELAKIGGRQSLIQMFQRNSPMNGQDLGAIWCAVNRLKTESGSNESEELAEQIQKLQNELESTTLCSICLDNERTMLLYPCRHVPGCVDCTQILQECPFCRRRIERTEHVHA